MGFSPGQFKDLDNRVWAWELSGDEIQLWLYGWDRPELRLSMSLKAADEAFGQLETLLMMHEGD